MKPPLRDRVRFTRAELRIINDMAAIASAQSWGEGDYQSFTEKKSKAFDSMRLKVHTLLAKGGKEKN